MNASAFNTVSSFGEHTTLNYNTTRHPFREYFESLYETTDLEHLHKTSIEYASTELRDVETELHKKFYKDIRTNDTFKRMYCTFVKDIYAQFFPGEKNIIFQSFPSIRLQFINNTAIPAHYDSDAIGMHPIGERNFLVPITAMYGTNRLFIESRPDLKDFEGITLNYGNLFMFNGNRCTHYNEVNTETTLRISLDFRVIHQRDYMTYIRGGQITNTNPRDPGKVRTPVKMIIGGYYQCSAATESVEEMMNWHMQKELLLQTRPNFDINEANACFEYMKDGVNFVTEYQQTTRLEKMIGEYIGVKHVLMTTSGSMALSLALLGCEIGPGDDVIVPDYTMIATINAVKMVGANPIIADVDCRTFTLTQEIIERCRTPKTKCVLFVSINNRQIDLAAIKAYCEETGLVLIEDAAQSLGARVGEKHFGTFGRVGCFSLSTPKIISTGQGGFVVTDDDALASKMTMIKNFGRKSGGIDVFETFGLNIKFTDIQAVIGIEQMKKLPGRVIQMRELYRQYYRGLQGLPVYMVKGEDDYLPWFVDIYTEKRDELAAFLKAHNIQTRPTYPEIHKTPMYLSDTQYDVTSYVSTQGLFLPSHTLVTKEEVQFICKIIGCFYDSS
jgi:perosamine synthetase